MCRTLLLLASKRKFARILYYLYHLLTSISNGDELPRAYIMPQSPDKATPETAENIKKWLAERVSRHKRLEGGVHFIEAIPKNPSGKILRKELREKAALEDTKARL